MMVPQMVGSMDTNQVDKMADEMDD